MTDPTEDIKRLKTAAPEFCAQCGERLRAANVQEHNEQTGKPRTVYEWLECPHYHWVYYFGRGVLPPWKKKWRKIRGGEAFGL